ncbi:MAG: hypothetical protein FJW20_04505 [Acidimicrobiia bacterium]|nr:hypothetical protein [Acidimicrobiia bacterium]
MIGKLAHWIGAWSACAGLMLAQTSSRTQIVVVVQPEVALSQPAPDTVRVKIRLGPQSQALLWRAESCATVPSDGYRLTKSGTHAVPVAAISGAGGRVCLASTDGALRVSLP